MTTSLNKEKNKTAKLRFMEEQVIHLETEKKKTILRINNKSKNSHRLHNKGFQNKQIDIFRVVKV